MTTPEFEAKMKQGPVGIMAVLVAFVTGRTHGPGAESLEVFRVSATVTFCCYVMAHWQNWIWWGRSTRFTVTYSLDGVLFALVTGATFAWLWPG